MRPSILCLYPIDSRERYGIKFLKFLKGYIGVCNICEKIVLFKIKSQNIREDVICSHCHSCNRKRQIVEVLLKFAENFSGIRMSKISDLKKTSIKIFNTEIGDPLDKRLSEVLSHSNYIAATFYGNKYKSGSMANGCLIQDLKRTSFPDEFFDVVITSEVMEHISSPYEAFKEIYRITKLGGSHIFSAPFYQEKYEDEVREIEDENGENIFFKEKIFHADPNNND